MNELKCELKGEGDCAEVAVGDAGVVKLVCFGTVACEEYWYAQLAKMAGNVSDEEKEERRGRRKVR